MDEHPASPLLPKRPKLDWRGLLEAGVVVTLAATFVGFLGPWWWCFDLFSHFVLQYAAVLLVAGGVLFAVRRKRFSAIALAGAMFNLAMIAPFYLSPATTPDRDATVVRALFLNVETRNKHADGVIELIQLLRPDILVLQEVDNRWLDRLKPVADEYPFSLTCPRSDNFGIALFTRLPVASSDIVDIGKAEVPSIVAEIEVDGRRFTLIATHPLPPGSAGNTRERNAHLADLAQWTTRAGGPVLVLGDLNVTPWNAQFRKLCRDGGLLNSMKGWGLQPTWPTFFVPAMIPLDHCLHSPAIVIHDRRTGPKVGSDHLPLMVDFSVRGGG